MTAVIMAAMLVAMAMATMMTDNVGDDDCGNNMIYVLPRAAELFWSMNTTLGETISHAFCSVESLGKFVYEYHPCLGGAGKLKYTYCACLKRSERLCFCVLRVWVAVGVLKDMYSTCLGRAGEIKSMYF